jgi:acetylornithine/succinyldiaminopimelate/putrescine aminotransferase
VPAAHFINALQEAGIIVIPSGSHVIRLLPPLILQKEHIDVLVNALKTIL